ncbi:MAG: hypothetical protein C4K49_02015 [Candidatus Thorarchaeota archaeon]|nr:MAG: hypothetical protein C4K49_02015 [Candidatus Thorarchaeota archaeon]
MLGQYRCGSLHAYDFKDYWLIHKDRWNPETHLWEHMVEDAPQWLAAAAVAGVLAGSALIGLLYRGRRNARRQAPV